MKKLGFFLLLIGLAFSACRKDTDMTTEEPNPFEPPFIESWVQPLVVVNGSVTGNVVNVNGEPVEAALVTMGNQNTTTDKFGHFFFKNTDLNARGTLVQVEKSGFFNGSRRFFAVADVENRVKIQLIDKNFSSSFESGNGGTVEMNGGATVTFSPNSIRNADGTPYTGEVRVASFWLDPANLQTLERMPGNLQGVNTLAEEVALTTMGMMAVELESPAGEKLNILDGETAEISMPIPDQFLSTAPAEIPNWSYNEEHGMWVEEGVSTKVGNNYVGQASHFSFWNHDFKDPLIEFTAVVQNEDGNPLGNYSVVISQPNSSLAGWGKTCTDGTLSGLIPMDYDLVLEIIGQCGDVIHSQNIGPFSDNTDLGIITVTPSTLNETVVTGELVDCDGNPVENGVISVTFDGITLYDYTDGDPFEFLFSSCSTTTEVEVVGIDLDNLLQTDPISANPNTSNDLGTVEVCDVQLQNYILLNIDGTDHIYAPASISIDSVFTFVFFNDQANEAIVSFGISGSDVGDYSSPNDHFIEVIFDNNNGFDFGQGESFSVMELTEVGAVGEPVIGNFSGTMTNYSVNPPAAIEVSGEFNIIRQ